jgi:D-glycero-alpha-D-manno-heptose-7-phosphate kinase
MRVVAQEVEAQLIRVPTGCQDYYPALYGGASAIHLQPGGVRREGLGVDLGQLDQRLLLVYTGVPRQSGINNWEVFQAHINGDRRVFRNFEEIAAIARAMRSALASASWDEVARLLRAEWKLRKTNAPGITTPRIEKLVAAALREGARAAKVCGAGGGGCVVFLVEKGSRSRVAEALTRNGGQLLRFRVARRGLAYGKAPSTAARGH